MKPRTAFLTAWLNGDTPNAAAQESAKNRVVKIITLLQEMNSAMRKGVPLWQTPDVGRIEAELWALTKNYQTAPRFAGESDGGAIGVAHMWMGGGQFEEMNMISLIEELVKAGLLVGLTMCKTCKRRWVFRNGKKGMYCSRECRQAPYEKSERRRALKRKGNREYYERWVKKAHSPGQKKKRGSR